MTMPKAFAGMKVIGADGVPVGTVEGVAGGRIKLTKADSGEGSHKGHSHYINEGLVADVEGNTVRLSANAAVAFSFEEEEEVARDKRALNGSVSVLEELSCGGPKYDFDPALAEPLTSSSSS